MNPPDPAPDASNIDATPPASAPRFDFTRWAIDHAVLIHLLVFLIVGAGAAAYLRLPREIFPSFSMGEIRITTDFPGASPGEVELLLTSPLETAVQELRGVEEITSESIEGQSRLLLELREDAPEIGRMLDEVQAAVDAIPDLPQESEESRIQEVETRFPVITASLFGEVEERVLRDLADGIGDDLRALAGVAQVTRSGVPEPIVWVELDEVRLREFGLTPADVAAALRAHNQNAPGGSVFTEQGDTLLRTLGEVRGVEELARIPLRSGHAGHEVTLGRVARVTEGFEDPPSTLGYMEGRPALNLTVYKDDKGDAIRIADAVQAYCARKRHELPAGVDLKTHGDLSVYIRNRLRTMNSTAILALGLVLACLYLFLSGRIALLTALGLPVAFLGTGIVLQLMGESFNMIAMFAFIIVLGMVVDDAIVLCENVYRHLEDGMSPREAAIRGTREVAAPVICTVATTMAAFLPMTMISGEIGKYMIIIPVVVSITLGFSLLEALVALPVHIAGLLSLFRSPIQAAPLAGLLEGTRRLYERVVSPILRYRYLALTTLFLGSGLLAAYGVTRLPFELFGEIESKQFFVNFESSPSTRIREMARNMAPAQAIVGGMPAHELESYNTNIGITFEDVRRFKLGSYRGQIFVDLWEGQGRERDSEEIINDLRDRLDRLPAFRKMQILRPQAGPAVPAIEIGIEGEDFGALRAISADLRGALARFDGVRDIRDDDEPGKQEIQFRLRPEAEALGLTVARLSEQIRQRFLFAEATRIHRPREAPEIRLRLQEDQRVGGDSLEGVWIQLPGGAVAPLAQLAAIERGQGPARISRTDQKRTITVFADVDRKRTNPDEVIRELREQFPRLLAEHPGAGLKVKGESQEMQRSMQDLLLAQVLALALIYILLATLFQSYLQPLVVMSVIPFAIDGVLVGHLVQGQNLSMLSMLGLIALAGIVVNDSLVLVSFINQQRARGKDVWEAVVEGGALRVRPILLTSITTIAGLVPLAFFASGQARFLAPMAISIVWGLAFATALTLVVIPCLYLVFDDLRRLVGGNR